MSPIRFHQIRKNSVLITALILVSTLGFPLAAQNSEPPEPIISQVLPSEIIWSVDSQKVAFNNTVVSPTANDWHIYDLNTGIVISTNQRPLTPSLTSTEQEFLTHTITLDSDQMDPLSRSPNGSDLVYGIRNGMEIVTNYGSFPSVQPGIANLQQSRFFTLPALELPGIQNTLWSADSSAFMLVQTIVPYDVVNVQYVTNYITNVSNVVLRDLRGGLWISDTGYAVNGAYDLSANGERALLRVNVPASSRTYKLYIYNGNYPTSDRLIEDFDATGVIAGSFAPGNENQLWLFNDIGIIQYDLVNGETMILNQTVNAPAATAITSNNPAIFSPDGRYLATLGKRGLYVIDLTEHIIGSPAIVTPTVEPDALRRLWVTTSCPTKPVATLTWAVHNPNAEAVTVAWRQDFRPERTILEVPGGNMDAPGVATFETPALPSENNTVQISVNAIFHDARKCFVPRED